MSEFEDFKFSMLSKRQLLKLCSAYDVKIQGALPNDKDSLEDILELVENTLQILDDGSIVRRDEKITPKEVKLSGGSKVRMIII
jgi:hypothetical protein